MDIYYNGENKLKSERGYNSMRFLIQRVTHAKVVVEGQATGEIGTGFLVFIGVSEQDTIEIADKLIKKLVALRIFEDTEGKTNLSLKDVGGSLLLVSQFTLYADCKKGNRPSFVHAQCRLAGVDVQTGVFGADMKVELENNGPFTVMLDSKEL